MKFLVSKQSKIDSSMLMYPLLLIMIYDDEKNGNRPFLLYMVSKSRDNCFLLVLIPFQILFVQQGWVCITSSIILCLCKGVLVLYYDTPSQ